MEKHTVLIIALVTIFETMAIGRVDAMRGPILKSTEPSYEKGERVFGAVDSMKNFNTKIKRDLVSELDCLKKLIFAYKKEAPLSQAIENSCEALLKNEINPTIKFLEKCSDKEWIDLLKIWNYLSLTQKMLETFYKTMAKRRFVKDVKMLEKHQGLFLKFKTNHLKSLAHHSLVQLLESTKKEGDVVWLNKTVAPLFFELPEGLKNHFISTGCVVDYTTPCSTKKILQFKKWLAKKGVAEKVITLLNINTPFSDKNFNVYSKVDIEALYNGDIPNLNFNTMSAFYKKRFFTATLATCNTLVLGVGIKHCLMPELPLFTDIILASGVGYFALSAGTVLGLQPNLIHKKVLDWAHDLKEELDLYK